MTLGSSTPMFRRLVRVVGLTLSFRGQRARWSLARILIGIGALTCLVGWTVSQNRSYSPFCWLNRGHESVQREWGFRIGDGKIMLFHGASSECGTGLTIESLDVGLVAICRAYYYDPRYITSWAIQCSLGRCGAALAASVLLLNVFALLLQFRRRRRHKCESCGYDLRGLVAHRCPECGTTFDPATLRQAEGSSS